MEQGLQQRLDLYESITHPDGWTEGRGKAQERNHQRARLAADARQWAQWMLLRVKWPKQRLY
jgi:hypothetical protein